MNPLDHEGQENIALTFPQSSINSQQQDTNKNSSGSGNISRPTLSTFGDDGMEESPLEPSILGSIIPSLDPEPPDPSRRNIFTSSLPLAGGVSQRPLPPAAPHDAGVPGTPFSGEGVTRGLGLATGRNGVEATAAAVAPGSDSVGDDGGLGTVGGSIADLQRMRLATIKRRKSSVKHGLRVLLRGSTRCGKSTILWDYCHRAAMAGHRVMLLCLKRHEGEDLTRQGLPYSMRSRGRPGETDELRGWEASALGRIGLKYVRSRDDLAWYLASLHTLDRKQWPTVIAVDDVDKMVETSAAAAGGGGGGGNGGGGGFGAAAIRISALLQDIAEFFDNSRAEARAAAVAASAAAADAGDQTSRGNVPQKVAERGKDSAKIAATPPPSGNLGAGSQSGRGGGAFAGTSGDGRRLDVAQEEAPVRVVITCSTSDRGVLSLYGRFVHVVARVQNTTGPDCFSVKIDTGITTAPHPSCSRLKTSVQGSSSGQGGFAPGFAPLDSRHRMACGDSGRAGSGGGGGLGGCDDIAQTEVGFVRSQLDGSFALF